MRGEVVHLSRGIGRHAQAAEVPTLFPFLYSTTTLRNLPPRWTPKLRTRPFSRHTSFRQKPPSQESDEKDYAQIYAQQLAEQFNSNNGLSTQHRDQNSTLTAAERAIFDEIYEEAEEREQNKVETEEEKVEKLIAKREVQETELSNEVNPTFAWPSRPTRGNEEVPPTHKPLLDEHDISDVAQTEWEQSLEQKQERRQLLVRRVKIRAEDDTTERRQTQGTVHMPYLPERYLLRDDSGEFRQALPTTNPDALAPVVREYSLDATAPESVALAKARFEDIDRLQTLITESKNDREIWRILESEVFSRAEELVSVLSPQTESEPKKKGRRKKKQKNPPGPIIDASSSAEPPATDGSVAKIDIPPPSLSITVPVPIPNAGSPPAASLPVSLAAFRMTYPHHLFIAQQTLRVRFPRSPYAVSILGAIKSLGPISYVLGASTELYEELLMLRWRTYRDPHACADLLGEMTDRGISTSIRTREIFRNAAQEWLDVRSQMSKRPLRPAQAQGRAAAMKQQAKEFSKFRLAWWSLEGVSSGFKRWQAIYEEDLARVRAEKERRERAKLEEEREFYLEEEDSSSGRRIEGGSTAGFLADDEQSEDTQEEVMEEIAVAA